MKNVLKYFHWPVQFLLFAGLIFTLSTCKRQIELPDNLIAQVNYEFLVLDQLNYMIPDAIDPNLGVSLKKNVISNWVDEEVLYQAALEEGYKLDAKEQFLLKRYEKSLIIQRYLNQKIDRSYRISQREIEDYYRDRSREFIHQDESVNIIHLLLEQRDNAIFTEIQNSRDLMEIIRKYSFDEKSTLSRPNGDLGYVALKNLPDQFSSVIKRMKTGSISTPIRSDQGYHFFQLLDRQSKGSPLDLELVKNEIMLRLKKERRELELDRHIKDLKEKAQIQTYLSKIQQ